MRNLVPLSVLFQKNENLKYLALDQIFEAFVFCQFFHLRNYKCLQRTEY